MQLNAFALISSIVEARERPLVAFFRAYLEATRYRTLLVSVTGTVMLGSAPGVTLSQLSNADLPTDGQYLFI